MIENLFTQSGLSLERLKTFREIVAAGVIDLESQGGGSATGDRQVFTPFASDVSNELGTVHSIS